MKSVSVDGAAGGQGTPGLTPVLERNIEAILARRESDARQATLEHRIADRITAFTGSMWSVYVHLALFGFWIVANLGWIPGVPRWDESFVVLAMFASVEAIFLSTFVLISQNRMAADAQRQADLDLQVNLLAEHEVTRLMTIVAAIAQKLDVRTKIDPEVEELKKDIAPEAVLDHIESSEDASGHVTTG